jgi:hypothetical protein
MLHTTTEPGNEHRARRVSMCACVWIGVAAVGCASKDAASSTELPSADGAVLGAPDARVSVSGMGGMQPTSDAAPPASTDAAASDAATGSDASAGVVAACGPRDTPEKGIQGDVNPGTVNCGLTLLSTVPTAGIVQGSGHCAYIRSPGALPYTGTSILAYSLADPLHPVKTDEQPCVGGSESMRAKTVVGRAMLVSGSGVYDISDCEKIVKKGEIKWPSGNAQFGLFFAALTSHEIAISHDAKRVYTGLGFGIAYIDDLSKPEDWTVKNWACEMNKQTMFDSDLNACQGPTQGDLGRQYSHSSDDNLEGTIWYGASQDGDMNSQMEPATARMVDIADRSSIEIIDALPNFPGHSLNFWKTPDGREFIMGANEGGGDSCAPYPRNTALGNSLDAYIAEVTGRKFGKAMPLTLDINKPENCDAAKAAGKNPSISETSIYNQNGAAFVMIEFGSGGLRIFDLRDGYHPREVAYFNDGTGFQHSGLFHYYEDRGLIVTSGSEAMHVLMLQPQVIAALGLPEPTDPKYPYK